MSFAEKLAGKLPSQTDATTVTESTDSIDALINELAAENAVNPEDANTTDLTEGLDELSGDDIPSDEDLADLGDDFDPDDLSDEDLAKLDASLSDDAIDTAAGVDDDTPEEKLSPSEELRADDMMAVAATTMLVNDELNAEERAAFVESGEAKIAVREGFMTEADVNEIATNAGLVTEARYTNKMIIRLNAEAKKKQLYALAVNVSAAAHNDPDYFKLKKVMNARRILRAKLQRKYHSEATKRCKVYFARLKKSKSPVLGKIGAARKED